MRFFCGNEFADWFLRALADGAKLIFKLPMDSELMQPEKSHTQKG